MAIHCVRPNDFNRKWIGMVPVVKPKAEKKIKKIKHGMNACNGGTRVLAILRLICLDIDRSHIYLLIFQTIMHAGSWA